MRKNIWIYIYTALLITIPRIYGIESIPYIREIRIISLIIMIVFFGLCFINKKGENKKIILLSVILFTYLVIIDIIKNRFELENIYSIIVLLITYLFIIQQLWVSNRILKTLYIVYTSYLIIDIFLICLSLIFRGTIYSFIGGKNAASVILIPTIFFIISYSMEKYKKITSLNKIYIILCLLIIFIMKSSTGIIAASICIVYFLLQKRINMNWKKYMVVYCILFIIIVFCIPMLKNTIINNIVKDLFNKDLTFSYRTELWKESLKCLGKSPLIGYGVHNEVIYNLTKSNNILGTLNETHNMVIELLLAGGMIGFILFFILLVNNLKNINVEDKRQKYLLFLIFLYLFVGMQESIFFRAELWMMLAVICSCSKKQNEE